MSSASELFRASVMKCHVVSLHNILIVFAQCNLAFFYFRLSAADSIQSGLSLRAFSCAFETSRRGTPPRLDARGWPITTIALSLRSLESDDVSETCVTNGSPHDLSECENFHGNDYPFCKDRSCSVHSAASYRAVGAGGPLYTRSFRHDHIQQ